MQIQNTQTKYFSYSLDWSKSNKKELVDFNSLLNLMGTKI